MHPRRIMRAYRRNSPSEFAIKALERGCVEKLRRAPRLYWRVAPRFYSFVREFDTDDYRAPLDPFKVVFVDPDRISRFTGREYPPWNDRIHRFGSIETGRWDQSRPEPGPEFAYHADLYLAETFENSVLHRSLKAHFVDGVSWPNTEFVSRLLERLESRGRVWHGCTTETAVLDRCHRIDRLYREIESSGYRSQRSLAMNTRPTPNFLEALENEIVLDIARDGTLLFVSGRHRLSIAKILDKGSVPVTFLVRHPEWMTSRDVRFVRNRPTTHPDCVEFRSNARRGAGRVLRPTRS